MGLSPIFNHLQTMSLGDTQEAIHVHGMPKKMHGHDALGFWGNKFFQNIEIQVPGSGLAINRNRHGPAMHNPKSGRNICAGANQDFVPGPKTGGSRGQFQRGGSTGGGHPVATAAVRSKLILKLIQGFAETSRNFSPRQGGLDRLDVLGKDFRFEDGYHDWT
jgi:hypothetical protein